MTSKLHAIDNPTSKPLLNSPKLLVSLPPKIIYARYNKLPNLEVIASSRPEVMVSKFNLLKRHNIPNSENYLRDKFKNNFKIKIKDNLMYIYHYRKIELEDHKKLFDMGINRLRLEYDE